MLEYDVCLYEVSHVLRNLLNIQDEKELNLAEAELSRANLLQFVFTELSTKKNI